MDEQSSLWLTSIGRASGWSCRNRRRASAGIDPVSGGRPSPERREFRGSCLLNGASIETARGLPCVFWRNRRRKAVRRDSRVVANNGERRCGASSSFSADLPRRSCRSNRNLIPQYVQNPLCLALIPNLHPETQVNLYPLSASIEGKTLSRYSPSSNYCYCAIKDRLSRTESPTASLEAMEPFGDAIKTLSCKERQG